MAFLKLYDRSQQQVMGRHIPNRISPDSKRSDTVGTELSREQEKVLAHSLRVAIMDLLQDTPMTAKEIATGIGSTVGNAHYHLQRLVAADLLAVVEQSFREGGVLEKRYRRCVPASLGNAVFADSHDILAIDEMLWLTVAETGQLVNELKAVLYRWRTDHLQARGRAQPLSLSIRCRTPHDG